MIVFDKTWFEKYQSRLHWFLNASIVKHWFRWVMGINRKEVINEIGPSYITYGGKIKEDKIYLQSAFYSDDVYANQLYYSFKPFWYLLHFLDWVLLDRVEALGQLSFGFLTLTVRPGSIGTDNPVDGYAGQTGTAAAWATIRGGAGDQNDYTSGTAQIIRIVTNVVSGWDNFRRGIFCFNTAALTSSASISATTISFWCTAKIDDFTDSLSIVNAAPAATDALANSDYALVGTTLYSTALALSSITADNTIYTTISLNATGIAAVSLTGITKMGTRSEKDRANTEPSFISASQTSLTARYKNNGDPAQDPLLIITYTLPSAGGGAKLFSLLGVGT